MTRPSDHFGNVLVNSVLEAVLDALVDGGTLDIADLQYRVRQAEQAAEQREAEWRRSLKERSWWRRLWS
jgi:hypothetical protein